MREVHLGSWLHGEATLPLEKQGLVRSSEQPLAGGRGGRARRVFELTPSGWDALREARSAAERMWRGLVHS